MEYFLCSFISNIVDIYSFVFQRVPPLIRPLVLIADIDKDVIVVTTVVVRISKIAWPRNDIIDIKINSCEFNKSK